MARVFTQHFRGTYKRPKNVNDLYRCVQYDNEANVDFISRRTALKNSYEGVSDLQAMHAFVQGLRNGLVKFMITSNDHPDLRSMLAMANRHTITEDSNSSGGKTDAYASRRQPRADRKANQEAPPPPPPKEVNAAFGKGGHIAGNRWKRQAGDKGGEGCYNDNIAKMD